MENHTNPYSHIHHHPPSHGAASTTVTPQSVSVFHDHHNMAVAHNHQDQPHDHEMRMWFHGGYNEVILFDWWRVNSVSGLFFSTILIFLMGVAYEGIKWLRVYMDTWSVQNRHESPRMLFSQLKDGGEGTLLEKGDIRTPDMATTLRSDEVYKSTVTRDVNNIQQRTRVHKMLRRFATNDSSLSSTFRLMQTLLYIIQLTLAYWLMLVAMTYNCYLTAAVVLGAGFGHWLFAILKNTPQIDGQTKALASDVCH